MSDLTAAEPSLPLATVQRGPQGSRSGTFGLFFRLAWQNLGRRPTRTLLLVLTVAVGSGAAFAAATVRHAVADSLAVGFARMGADLLVVPRATLVNLTPALLTVEPTPHTLDPSLADEVARLPGVAAVAPPRYFPVRCAAGAHAHDADPIAFDPHPDCTVTP